MPRIFFIADHDFKANRRVIIAYKAGHEYLVSQAAAAEAFRLRKAIQKVAPRQRQKQP